MYGFDDDYCFETEEWGDDRDRDHGFTGLWRASSFPGFDIFSYASPEACARILGAAIAAYRADPDKRVSYSRRRDWYTYPDRYWPKQLTYLSVTRTVGQLDEQGVLDHEKSEPGQRGRQSRFRLSDDGARLIGADEAQLTFAPPEIIILRSANRKNSPYEDTPETERMRGWLARYNDVLRSLHLSLGDRAVIEGHALPDLDGGVAQPTLSRIFNRTFDFGGRFYRAWWQNIPKERRKDIRFDGGDSFENDYPTLHPTMIYAMAGKRFAGNDPYELLEHPRGLGKLAFNACLNANDANGARKGIAKAIAKKRRKKSGIKKVGMREFTHEDYVLASRLASEIEHKHEAISGYLHTGIGLELQCVDSDMAESVMARLMASNIPCLPVHDSFIVPARAKAVLEQTMDDVFDRTRALLSDRTVTGYSLPIPQYRDVPQYGSEASRSALAVEGGLGEQAIAAELAQGAVGGLPTVQVQNVGLGGVMKTAQGPVQADNENHSGFKCKNAA